jgi:ribonuclease E
MGAGASVQIDETTSNVLKEESLKPLDASDVATPRGESAKAEVIRLRALIAENAKKTEATATTTEEAPKEGGDATAETTATEAPKEEAPKEEAPKEGGDATAETTATEAPKEEAPKEEAPKEEAPKEEAPKEEAPKEEAPKEEAPKAEA